MNTIKLKYGLEDVTARVPGMFPYIEFDGNHVSTLHPSSDSDSGCYGKIACAITIPFGVSLDISSGGVRKSVVASGKSYSYRTLMLFYYKYRETYPSNSFILFMERGIGRFDITADIDFEHCTLVPEYEYYANCARLFDEYAKIGIICTKYLQMKEITGEVNCELECLVDKYNKMGGDVMRDYYGSLVPVSNEISAEYFGYASNDFNLSFNLNITTTEDDLGILNAFVDFFGEKYINVLYAQEKTAVPGTNPPIYELKSVPIVRVVDPEDPTHPRSQDTMNGTEKYYLDSACEAEAERGVDYFLPGDFVIYDDRTYICERPTINGEWDSNRFHMISEDYTDAQPDYGAYYNPDTGFTPSDILSTSSNSQLGGFIGDTRYTDESGAVLTPMDYTDWLWYYRVGLVGSSETITDRFSNIDIKEGETRVETIGEYEPSLMAYGDIITSITRNKDERTLEFTYVIGAHFKAKLMSIELDDDNNKHYYYSEYEYDSDDSHGLRFTETYDYEAGGDIDEMSDEIFDYYITHGKLELDRNDSSMDPSVIVGMRYTKAPFSTYSYINYGEMSVNGSETSFPYIASDYETKTQLNKDTIVNPVTKLDYLTGIPYKPTVKSDVHISRGNASAWERHIKLGELKTFDDLENYSNGGFFNLR